MPHRRCALLLVLVSSSGCAATARPTEPPETAIIESVAPAPTHASSSAPLVTGRRPGSSVLGVPNPDARPASRRGNPPRSRALLVTELHGLEVLAAHTPREAKDHPQLLRRIANDYVELSCSARADGERPVEATARAKAKATFEKLEADHPGFAPNDELLFFMARQYEQIGDTTSARATYQSLVYRHPSSRYVPAAHVAIGDIYYEQAEEISDPSRRTLAKEAYEAALQFPSLPNDTNEASGYASYRLAWVLEKEGDHKGAAAALRSAIDFADKHVMDADAARLGAAARADLDALGEH